jgi:hypothetical protein
MAVKNEVSSVRWSSEHVPATGRQAVLHTAAASQGAVWAFGISVPEDGPFLTLVFRREDRGWCRVEAPSIGRANRAIAICDADVWVVGDGQSLHWDGSRWQHIPTADLHDAKAQLFGLAQFGPADVWTAGYAPRRDHSGARGTVQRWDGVAWTDLPLPAVAQGWSLAGIGGVSPDDLWAVGRGQPGEGVALHWDGRDWQHMPIPAPGSGSVKLCDVVAVASDDVWAAGYRTSSGGGARTRQSFAAHWDGSAWSPGDLPAGPGQIWQLVKDDASIWGIGYAPDSAPIITRMNGAAWQSWPGPVPLPPARSNSLHGGTMLPDGDLMVVGATSLSQDSLKPFAARGFPGRR